MSATSATLSGRKAAERMMVDACTIVHQGDLSFDHGEYTTIAGPAVYAGKCKVQIQGTRPPKTPIEGEALLSLVVTEIHVPMTVVGVQVHDRVTITASQSDPDLVGRIYEVMDHAGKSFATARRMRCEEYR